MLQLCLAVAAVLALVAAALLHDHAASRCAPASSSGDVSALSPCVAPDGSASP